MLAIDTKSKGAEEDRVTKKAITNDSKIDIVGQHLATSIP